MDSKEDKLLLPKEFYYSQDSSKVRYSNKPSGQIEINRVIKGQTDCFISGAGSRTENQKKLIFAPWTAKNWDERKIALVQKQLSLLIDQGFFIYLWQSGNLSVLNKEDLQCLTDTDILKKITLEQPETIINASVAQQKLTRDSILILDDYWLERIEQSNNANMPRNLKISDFVSLEPEEREQLPNILEKSYPKLTQVIYDTLSSKSMDAEQIFYATFKHIGVEEKIETIRINFKFQEKNKKITQLEHLKQLVIPNSDKINENDLIELLRQAVNLEDIDFKEGRDWQNIQFTSLPEECLSKLKRIKVEATRIPQEQLIRLLQSKDVEQIHLARFKKKCTGAFESFTKEAAHNKLTQVDLEQCNITTNDLAALFTSTALENLTICNSNLTGDVSVIETMNLDTLKELNIFNDFPYECLLTLVNAPNLEKISLYRQAPGVLKKIFSETSVNRFNKLKSANIFNFFDADFLRLLANNAPNLEQIKLVTCQNTSGNFSILSGMSFPNLRKIDLPNSVINPAALSSLLQTAPHLVELNVKKCEFLSNDLSTLSNLSLLKLKKINLSMSKITPDVLIALLQTAPNLEEIDLSFCENISGDFPDVFTLSKLKKINLYHSAITPNAFNTLLKAAPNLEEINLGYCSQLTPLFVSPDISLQHLKKIYTYRNTITADALLAFLQTAPHLEELSLEMLNISANDFPVFPNLYLYNLKKIDLASSSNITPNIFNGLLQAAPYLEEINLGNLKLLDGQFSLANHSLVKLKKIHCNSLITIDLLNELLKASPNLEEIDFERGIVYNDSFCLSNLNLRQLKKINFLQSNLTFDALSSLLQISPNLEEINLSNMNNLSVNSLNPSLSLPKLKKLNLLQSDKIDGGAFSALLNAAPNLEEINISYTKIFDDFSTLSKLSLHKIKRITLRCNTSGTVDMLIALAQVSTPYLEEIETDIDLNRSDRDDDLLQALKKIIDIKTLSDTTRLKLTSLCEALELKIAKKTQPLPKKEPTVLHQRDPDAASTRSRDPYPGNTNSSDASPVNFTLGQDVKNIPSSFLSTNAPGSSNAHIALEKAAKSSDADSEQVLSDELPTKSSQVESCPPSTLNKKEHSLDADTEHKKKEFKLDRFFYSLNYNDDPSPELYRLTVFNTFATTEQPCKLNEAFKIDSDSDAKLKECVIKRLPEDVFKTGQALKQDEAVFYGKRHFDLGDEWQAIPSLEAGEALFAYHTEPTDANIEIQYSERDSLYYIKSTAGKQSINLDFLIKIPEKICTVPKDIQAMIAELNTYGSGALEIQSKKPNGQDYLNCMRTQKKGACRHRAFVFAEWMKTMHPEIPVRMITNDCHAFAEINLHGTWNSCQLGGYDAELTIRDTYSPVLAPDGPAPVTIKPLVYTPIPDPSYSKYDVLMQPWKKEGTSKKSYKSYLQKILHIDRESKGKNHLIELDSNEAVSAMLLGLQSHCQQTHRPFFYIHSPEDVVCSSHFLKQQHDKTGILCKGPGGPLHDFLTQAYKANNPPVLLVNYANFNADDIVRLNTLLDENRSADTTPISEQTTVIGVINIEKPDCYQGSDFYSRFHHCDHNPVNNVEIQGILHPVKEKADEFDTHPINLYHASDWKAKLLGSWVLNEGKLFFQEGLLLPALQGLNPVEIQNGPWEDPEFTFFWQQLSTVGLEHEGKQFRLDPQMLFKSDGYDWKGLTQGLKNLDKAPEMILNPGNLSDYFHRYACINEQKTLIALKGHIQEAANSESFNVHLTRTLNEDEWALLLAECQKHGVALQVYCAPGVKLPDVLQPILQAEPIQKKSWNVSDNKHTQVISSTDPDTTIDMLIQQDPHAIMIDVSECKASDLLMRTTPKFKKDKLIFEFTESPCALLTALEQGKSVILKGRISDDLADALAALLLSRKQSAAPGRLIVISHEKDSLNYYPESSIHNVTKEDKQACCKTYSEDINWQESLSTIKARLQFPQGWEGLSTLKTPIEALEAFDIETSQAKTIAFNSARQDSIVKVLDNSPYVFIAGLSGVGKSTFVEKELFKGIPHTLHMGENNLGPWANDSTQGLKLLFIDEANLSMRQWTEFEGLFHTPPRVLINGIMQELTPEHKVIFAGNPVSYGDERTLSSFFIRHGRAVVFTPLPLAIIYEQIINPVFSSSDYVKDTAKISKPFLDVYNFLCQLSTTEILISPRELQMMALLTLSYCQKMPDANPELVAAHYAYEVAKSLIPTNYHDHFKNKFAPSQPIPTLPLPEMETKSKFKITESRKKTATILNEVLMLRESRAQGLNDEQKYGGLGGVILEGEPGVGKSELVMAMLQAHGFVERTLNQKSEDIKDEKVFYHLKLSMSKTDREKLLLKAFDEGAVVVIDEINSSTMMERLLNDLLMGKNPYAADPRPKHPGFMVIGTQNPVTMAGRRAASTALSRRLYREELPPYPRNEILEIIRGVSPLEPKIEKELEELVDSYIKNSELAQKHYYSPAPTFRDVLRIATQIKSKIQQTASPGPMMDIPSYSELFSLWGPKPSHDVQAPHEKPKTGNEPPN